MRTLWTRALLVVVLGTLGATQMSCGVNDYCLNCGKGGDDGGHDGNGGGDGGGDDGGGDGGGSGCVPSGPEICDGIDNDCNGVIDDGVLPGVGDACANQMGECAGGVQQCTPSTAGDLTTDKLTCSKKPTPEICDNKDNDCNGLTDEGDPGGGGKCGTDTGACVAGTNHCVGGSIQCVGFQDHTHDPELCNLLDDNCNGMIDEGLTNMGTCGIKTCVGGTAGANDGTICQTGADCTNGATCAAGVGACHPGTLECLGGISQCCSAPHCSVTIGTTCAMSSDCPVSETCIACPGVPAPSIELCDGIDNDCDGNIDEGFDFTSDINHCGGCSTACAVASKTCVDSSNVGATCTANADCPGGSCVENSVPTCTIDPITHNPTCGMSCKAGFNNIDGIATNGCEYPCFNSGIEVCDGIDNDCNGVVDDNLGPPPAICATKGACATGTTITCNGDNGWKCNYGANVSTDINGNIIPETSCDGIDNDCNGRTDDNQPNVGLACSNSHQGACNVGGTFVCDPGNTNGPAVCTAGTGHCSITATTGCTVNTQCPMGETCTGGCVGKAATNPCTIVNQQGVSVAGTCATFGTELVCNPTPGLESCNGLDDDCDGVIDNNPTTPWSFPAGGIEWVNIGAGHQMMKYEASKPDSTSGNGGALTTNQCGGTSTIATNGVVETGGSTTITITTTTAHGIPVGRVVVLSGVANAVYNGTYIVTAPVTATTFTIIATAGLGTSTGGTVAPVCPTCSVANRIPWTNVTYPQASAACAAVGATLCTEQQWHRACSVTPSPETYPIAYTSGIRIIEAENYFTNTSAIDTTLTPNVSHAWAEDYTPAYSGMSAMQAVPDTGSNLSAANTPTMGPHLDYTVTFATAATYHFDVLMYAVSSGTNGGNLVMVSVDGQTGVQVQLNTTGVWTWVTSATFAVTTGTHTIHLYMMRDGVRVDAIAVADSATTPTIPAAAPGNTWAYGNGTPNTYSTTTCNGHDYDPTQDATIATGTLTSCYADDSPFGTAADHAFDMSGNVKEWTLARQPGQNGIRGGASNSTNVGTSCPLNFTLGDDKFFFPNVGFRCCR